MTRTALLQVALNGQRTEPHIPGTPAELASARRNLGEHLEVGANSSYFGVYATRAHTEAAVSCMVMMIARTWSGATDTEDAPEYESYMHRVALPGYAEVPGNRLVLMLRRDRDDNRTEFTMTTLWEDMEAVRSFTGPDAHAAVFYAEDDRFLVERDQVARHHVVYGLHRSLLGWSPRHLRALGSDHAAAPGGLTAHRTGSAVS